MLDASFSDATCGFKAIRADKARWLLPLVQDNTWFFDTELLILGERAGLRVHEVPVDWIDDPDSRVDVVRTAAIDLRGVARLCWSSWRGTLAVPGQVVASGNARGSVRGLPGQVLRFMGIGAVSLLAYVGIYLATRVEFSVQVANMIGLVLTTAGNIAANRRITFGIRGYAHVARDQIQWALAFGAGLALTEVALASLRAVALRPSQFAELMTLITANLVASLVRFILFRSWVFRPRQLPPPPRVAVGAGPQRQT
jgi:putative flippase GtrA